MGNQRKKLQIPKLLPNNMRSFATLCLLSVALGVRLNGENGDIANEVAEKAVQYAADNGVKGLDASAVGDLAGELEAVADAYENDGEEKGEERLAEFKQKAKDNGMGSEDFDELVKFAEEEFEKKQARARREAKARAKARARVANPALRALLMNPLRDPLMNPLRDPLLRRRSQLRKALHRRTPRQPPKRS